MSANNSTMNVAILPTFDPTAENVAILITLTFIVLLTIFGNLMVLIAFMLEPKLRNEAFNYFIFNLAITDFLVAITAMTFYTIDTVLGYWPFGPGMCAFWIYADYAMTFASVFTLTAISVDRYWSVTWPIHYRIHSTVRKTMIMIGIVWACVFIIWTPPFIGDRLKNNEMYTCIWEPSENREFIIVVDVIGHYLPCTLMVVSYAKVFMVMRNRAKVGHGLNFDVQQSTSQSKNSTKAQTSTVNSICVRTVSNENTSHHGIDKTNGQLVNKLQETENSLNVTTESNMEPSSSVTQSNLDIPKASSNHRSSRKEKKGKGKTDDIKYNKMERKIFITLSYVIICYLICWFPFYVTWDIYAFHPDLVPPLLYTIMFWMTYINSTLNPIIYAYTNKDFRRTFLGILRCRCK